MALRNDLNAQIKSDLTNFSSAIDGQAYLLLGENAMGDRTLRVYYYDIGSSATADGDNILAASGMSSGRFIKIPIEEFGTVNSIALSSSDLSISGSPITSSGSITTNLTTTGVGAGSYGIVTVDTKGRTSAGKRQEVYSGTTNSSGVYIVTFASSYSVAPNIQVNIVGGASNQLITTVVSTSGFTCTVVQQDSTTILGVNVLLPTTTNVNGALVDVLITEK